MKKTGVKKLVLILATGFGSGTIPWASGTWGSAVGLLVLFGLQSLRPLSFLVTLITLFFLGVWASAEAEKIFGEKDSGKIVIDEVVGQLISLFLIPLSWKSVLLGFFLFRLFDIWKPFPARWFQDHLKGGWGVMMDDVMAGIYVNLILQFLKVYL